MQTFLPFPGFPQSAAALDRQRLAKQRTEVLQILHALTNPGYGWQHHPAVRMWRGYTNELVLYGVAVCDEWIARGYKDTCKAKIRAFAQPGPIVAPGWRGDPAFHSAHRAVLLAKAPAWYGRLGWAEAPAQLVDGKWPYVWPR